MGQDRITEITIEGLRSIARLSLPLRGLTVLIGELRSAGFLSAVLKPEDAA